VAGPADHASHVIGIRLQPAVPHQWQQHSAAEQIADYERLTPGVLQCTPGTQMLQFCVSHHRASALIAA
jgi:hypothetical protein